MQSSMKKIDIRFKKDQVGFTLLEILIVIVIAAVTLSATFTIVDHMQNSSVQQVAINMLQQNQRGSLAIMERELRLIGMDMNQAGGFGVTDVRKFAITDPLVDATPDGSATGSPILRITLDLNDDKTIGGNETVTYSLFDRDGDGQPPYDLSRSTTLTGTETITGRELLAEGIEAIGFAYAFDADDDGKIDRAVLNPGDPPSIIWAVDTDNDGQLDADLGGTSIGMVVRPQAIRAVQIWILGCTLRPDNRYSSNQQYSVGDRILGPYNDHFRRWLLSEIIHCRNL